MADSIGGRLYRVRWHARSPALPPDVVVGRVSAHGKSGVYRPRPAGEFPARVVGSPTRDHLGRKLPIVTVPIGPMAGEHGPRRLGDYRVVGAGLEQQHLPPWVLAETRRQECPGGAGPDDDVVVCHRHPLAELVEDDPSSSGRRH
jgi:hypothetical protein